MMKHSLSLIAAVFLLSGASNLLAASAVDLSVKGTITPSACTPTLSSGGVVEHGKISMQDLHPYQSTRLADATLQLTVNCAASTLFAIQSHDNREGTSAEWNGARPNYGLGLANGDVKIGWYMLKMINPLADSVPRAVIESIDGKTWLDAPTGTVWQPGWMRSFNGAAGGDPVPLSMVTMQVDVVVETTIADKRKLPADQEIPLDGSATLDVVYL